MPTTLIQHDSPRTEVQDRAHAADRYALVQDAHMVSAWDSYDEAVREGYRVFGLEPFSVREFRDFEPGHASEA